MQTPIAGHIGLPSKAHTLAVQSHAIPVLRWVLVAMVGSFFVFQLFCLRYGSIAPINTLDEPPIRAKTATAEEIQTSVATMNPTLRGPSMSQTPAATPKQMLMVDTPTSSPLLETKITPFDDILAQRYNEDCVRLHAGHLEAKFIRKGVCFSRKRVQQILIDLVGNTTAVFMAHGIESFLDSGTLLGSYRHNTVIPYDQDADVGITEAGYEVLKETPIQFPPEYHLQVFGSKWHPKGTRFIELPARVVHRDSALYVDVFVYKEWKTKDGNTLLGPIPSGCFVHCKNCPRVATGRWEFKIPRDWIYPLQDCVFAQHMLKCPAQAPKYLEKMFGPDYMVPNRLPKTKTAAVSKPSTISTIKS